MSTSNPVATRNQQAALAGVHLPASAQHVIDALESHLGAVLEHAKTANPAATRVIAGFADRALDKLEAWGLEVRGDLEGYRAKVDALLGEAPAPGASGSAGSGSPTTPAAGTGSPSAASGSAAPK